MVGLLDIAPISQTLDVQGIKVQVWPLSIAGIAQLLQEFPELAGVLTGSGIDVPRLMAMAPNAIASIIAIACRLSGDANAIAVAAGLPVASQVELLHAIIEMTMPGGVGPLVDRITSIAEAVVGGPSLPEPKAAPAMKSPSPSKP